MAPSPIIPHALLSHALSSPFRANQVRAWGPHPSSLACPAISRPSFLPFRATQLFRLFRLVKLNALLKRLEDHLHINPAALRLMKLLVMLTLMWHWMG